MVVEHVGPLKIKCDATGCSMNAEFTVRLRLTPGMVQMSNFCGFCKDKAISLQQEEAQKETVPVIAEENLCQNCLHPDYEHYDGYAECRGEYGCDSGCKEFIK